MIPINNKEKIEKEQNQEQETVPQAEETAKEKVAPEAKEEKKQKKEKKHGQPDTESENDTPEGEAASEGESKQAGGESEIPAEDAMAILNDKYLRVCAEYDNFRKRTAKEKDALYGDIRSNVVSSFLPVYDNLTRALEAKTEDEAYRKGVEMIMTQFNQTLEKLGVTEIPALGEKFNPEFHNAVMHVDDETKGENEIVEVFQKGFKLGDKIIRASMVKVAN